jgi:hypothetical protein
MRDLVCKAVPICTAVGSISGPSPYLNVLTLPSQPSSDRKSRSYWRITWAISHIDWGPWIRKKEMSCGLKPKHRILPIGSASTDITTQECEALRDSGMQTFLTRKR